jgi:hypothetical protein
MESHSTPMSEVIAEEAACYLSVVALFRSLGCEPHWRAATQAPASAPRPPATHRRKT